MRPSHSTVVAYLALFVALGGVSWAALKLPRNSVGAKQIKKGAVRSADVKDGSLKAADLMPGSLPAGPQGERGPQGEPGATGLSGATGPAGAAGAAGADGSDAASAVFARTDLPSGSGTYFLAASGYSEPDFPLPQRIISPPVAMVARDLQVRLQFAPGGGIVNRAFRLVLNDANTTLRCQVNSGQTACSNTSAAIAVPAGSVLYFESTAVNNQAATRAQFTWRLVEAP